MARRFTLADLGHVILREADMWGAFTCVGVPNDQAPVEIAADVAEANALIGQLNAVFIRIATACGIDLEEER